MTPPSVPEKDLLPLIDAYLDHDDCDSVPADALLRPARDEIARLRDEVETWKERAGSECTAKVALQFQLDAALALIESIRTAYGIDVKDPGPFPRPGNER
jgi:hypothetical protein